ncbi:MAG: DUF1549 domain-containing protein [Pirellulaceae bacterium]|nr:DUF1549 domain-containing protein [Pirellulaceae bacterium]
MMRLYIALLTVLGLAASLAAGELSFTLPEHATSVQLKGQDARWQLLVSSCDQQGQWTDVTHHAKYSIQPPIAEVDAYGYLRPLENGQAQIVAELSGQRCEVSLSVSGMESLQPVDFHHQVVPIFTKLGCNGGGCHGKAAGQAGFKLSLLGFEAQDDYDRLVLESRGRRVFPAMPDQSLLLLKATGAAPHGGGQRMEVDSHEYRVLRRWIASGMPLGDGQQRMVTRIEVLPASRQLSRRLSQQLAVIATYSDDSHEDITRTAQFDSNNTDLANVDERGWVQLGDQAGDVAIMARYQGQVAVFRASVPLGVPTEEFPPTRNLVDQAVFAKLQTLGIPPSPLCDDSTFVRRATLDIAGRLPTPEESQQYLASSDADKAERLVDRLLDSQDYANYFARKWILILRNRRDSPGHQLGSFAFHGWLRDSFLNNKPYDHLVRELLTASGSVQTHPPLVWWREVSDTESRVEDVAQLFLGQRLQCARCHHHPFEKWSQSDYYQMSAFFSTVAKKEGASPDNPVFVSRVASAIAKHPKTGQELSPRGLDAPTISIPPSQDPRQQLVDWMVDPSNPFFARSLVNRYWKHFLGSGLVEPEDDMRVTNPPSNSELLEALSQQFVASGFDLKNLIRTICTSSVYRLSSEANDHNLRDSGSYSRYYPKRLSAEVMLDAIDQTVMTVTAFDGMPNGSRAVELPDTGFASYFLDVFGRPAGSTACECERMNEASLAQSLHLLNSKEVQAKLTNDAGRAAAISASSQPLDELIHQLYMAAFSRPANEAELQTAAEYVNRRAESRRQAFEDLVWAVINSKEFLFNH